MTKAPFIFTLSSLLPPNPSFAPPNLSFPRRRESPALVPSLSNSHPFVLALPTQPFALRFPSGRTAHPTGLAYSSSPPNPTLPLPPPSCPPPNTSFQRRRESPALVPSLSISHPSVLTLPTQPFALRFPSGRTAHPTGLAYSSSPPNPPFPHSNPSFPRRRESRAHSRHSQAAKALHSLGPAHPFVLKLPPHPFVLTLPPHPFAFTHPPHPFVLREIEGRMDSRSCA